MKKYTIGVDYGTLSGRAVLLDLETGELIAQAVKPYTHQVMDESLPDGTPLKQDWALQHPNDYLEVLFETIPKLMNETKIPKDSIIGMSIDFTACTMIPVDDHYTPFCFIEGYQSRPHAYVKLWKHHAAQKHANELNRIARDMDERFLSRYGGKISSEWMFPKIMQIKEEAPDIYQKARSFVEATDWVNFMLTGVFKRNACTAGYKALWHKQDGYPHQDFFKAIGLDDIMDKMDEEVISIGSRQGYLTPEMANKLGLTEKVAVAAANVDAHVSLPAVGVTQTKKMLLIIGTSTCNILLGNQEKIVPGMCGVVEDGVIEGFFGYEAGQSCVGDHFDWFISHMVPASYTEKAKVENQDIHQYLTNLARKQRVGEHGLIALDWWNGNRSVLVDTELTGMFIGMNLLTKPEDMYRALLEATAFGQKMIIETFTSQGVEIEELYACGGISKKNDLMMQIYADVTHMNIHISSSDQTPALGSAMFGAVAAGYEKSGYKDINDISHKLGKIEKTYYPNEENHKIYQKMYAEYKLLHDYFGRGINDVMKRLKALKEI